MTTLLGRVEVRDGTAVVASTGVRVGEVMQRLESGEGPAEAVKALGLDPLGLLGALAFVGLADGGPPLVQAPPKRPSLAKSLSEASLAGLFPRADRASRLALSAGLLQSFGFWEASHEAAQQADDLGERSTSAYWHGIAHRREPDAGNAAYWFRRVGRHPIFPALAKAAPGLAGPEFAGRVAPGGEWSPTAFIAACGNARGAAAVPALALQRAELALLLDASIPT